MSAPASVFGPNICLSGGAEGADLMWGMCAGAAGHSVVHWSFAGHRSNAPPSEVVILSDGILSEADEPCREAATFLGRQFLSTPGYVRNLLRRNFFQIRDSLAVYAVATIEDGEVSGGTAWATAMFILRHEGRACPCYVFCQKAERWHEWDGGWVPIETPPVPTHIWTGIGSRKLGDAGKAAIRSLLGWTAPSAGAAQ